MCLHPHGPSFTSSNLFFLWPFLPFLRFAGGSQSTISTHTWSLRCGQPTPFHPTDLSSDYSRMHWCIQCMTLHETIDSLCLFFSFLDENIQSMNYEVRFSWSCSYSELLAPNQSEFFQFLAASNIIPTIVETEFRDVRGPTALSLVLWRNWRERFLDGTSMHRRLLSPPIDKLKIEFFSDWPPQLHWFTLHCFLLRWCRSVRRSSLTTMTRYDVRMLSLCIHERFTAWNRMYEMFVCKCFTFAGQALRCRFAGVVLNWGFPCIFLNRRRGFYYFQ